MDCAKLNQQIKELEEEYQAFSEEMENFTEYNPKKLQEFDSSLSELEKKRDEILKEHLDEIYEKNPELNEWKFGEVIESELGVIDSSQPIMDENGKMTGIMTMDIEGRACILSALEKSLESLKQKLDKIIEKNKE